MDVVGYISQQSMDLGMLGDNKIDHLHLIPKDLITVERSEKIINAFLKIYNYILLVVGIIDDKRNIIENIDFEDLELIGFLMDSLKGFLCQQKSF